MPAEQLAQLFEVLEGGVEVAAENIVQFPVDAAGAASETALAGEGISTLVQLGNGAAAEVSQLTVVESATSAATTTGIGILGVEVGAAGAAIAPALGILAGVGLYNLAPDFWTNVSNKLVSAGQTVGGKIRAFLNGSTGEVGYSQETIDIFKNAFIEARIFEEEYIIPPTPTDVFTINSIMDPFQLLELAKSKMINGTITFNSDTYNTVSSWMSDPPFTDHACIIRLYDPPAKSTTYDALYIYATTFSVGSTVNDINAGLSRATRIECFAKRYSDNSKPANIYSCYKYGNISSSGYHNSNICGYERRGDNIIVGGGNITISKGSVQPDATYPTANDSISVTYPDWQPWSVPSTLPQIYPVELPVNNPEANQEQAQNPASDPEPAPYLNELLNLLQVPQPNLNPDPTPAPEPEPDPDPQPEPEPLPEEEEAETDENPVDPNKPPTPSDIPAVVPLPATVDSNCLFTVYNPSLSQLNSLGAYLWSSDIIDQLLKMWQNPLDGIISLQKVYAIPSTGSTRNIILGYLDSGVPAPIVTSQFQTIQCGTVEIKEMRKNATDYTPYVELHLYLPFIGFVELDPNEFMNGVLTVIYKVDMYTGTCLADVKCTRTADIPNATTLYQFSGNASQQIPLTSGSANGLISALVSVVGTGVAVASGGALGVAGAALQAGHSLTHEMLHVGHSGSLSANAGIMGSRKPAVVIGRQQGFDANGYNELYGYPANKTVYLGNLSGYARVKACRLRTKATENEKAEIEQLLKKGVIL